MLLTSCSGPAPQSLWLAVAALNLDRASSCHWLDTSLISPLRFLHSCTTVAQLRWSPAKVCVSKLLYGLPVLLHSDTEWRVQAERHAEVRLGCCQGWKFLAASSRCTLAEGIEHARQLPATGLAVPSLAQKFGGWSAHPAAHQLTSGSLSYASMWPAWGNSAHDALPLLEMELYSCRICSGGSISSCKGAQAASESPCKAGGCRSCPEADLEGSPQLGMCSISTPAAHQNLSKQFRLHKACCLDAS